MIAGFDFGTSNCELGVWRNGRPELVALDGDRKRIASTLFMTKKEVPIEDVDEQELRRRVGVAKSQQAREREKAESEGFSYVLLPDEKLLALELARMRRELAQRRMEAMDKQSLAEAIASDGEAIYGEKAVKKHLADPRHGFFVSSPKTFLGVPLRRDQLEVFAEITTKMMANVKMLAEDRLSCEIRKVVIGRPVNFHSTDTKRGNEQAIGILERSAFSAGFDEVRFLYEPVAAALDYERSLVEDKTVLVLDLGGGTTDCSVIRLGPSFRRFKARDDSILGYSGDRVGGNDIDIRLAYYAFTPYFGRGCKLKDGLPVPVSIFWDAVSINSIPVQNEFYQPRTAKEIEWLIARSEEPESLRRLKILQERRLSYRLCRSAELGKIHLSDYSIANVPLRYIEPDLVIRITRKELAEAVDRVLERFAGLMKEAENQAGTTPDVVYVTGGTAKSPVVKAIIEKLYKGRQIVVGDYFGSVASGLATWAYRQFC